MEIEGLAKSKSSETPSEINGHFSNMRARFLCACLGALTLVATSVQGAQTYTFRQGAGGYAGTVDTQIRGASPDRDDSLVPVLNPDGADGGGANHVLIRFEDLFGSKPGQIPAGSTILAASLTLQLTNAGDPQELYRMLSPWAETVTWNQFDPVNHDGLTPGAPSEIPFEPDVVFETPIAVIKIPLLPATLQAWSDGTALNHGWAIVPTGTNGADFGSSENPEPDRRPMLTVVAGTDGDLYVQDFRSSATHLEFLLRDGTFLDGRSNPLNTETVSLALDGQGVRTEITRTGDLTSVLYRTQQPFESASSHTVRISFAGKVSAGNRQSNERTFTVDSYPALNPASAAAGSPPSNPGFRIRMTQMTVARGPGNQNSAENAERQLAGEIIDPDTGKPYGNTADLFLADPDGWFSIDTVINWEQEGGNAGGFRDSSEPPRPDTWIPGIPGNDGSTDHFAAEILTWLELDRGFYRFGVNSDDGFTLSTRSTRNGPFDTVLSGFNGSRNAQDTLVDVSVAEPGIYPFRLAWWAGTGGASIEFFSVNPVTDERILVNDPDHAGSIHSYHAGFESPQWNETLQWTRAEAGGLILEFSGTLQSAPTVTGPYRDVPGAPASPAAISLTGPGQFYRTRP